jgi:predicted metalloprotease with PDZ domain
MFGEGNYDSLRLQKDMKRIVEECTSVFGSHPCKKYLFIIHNLASGGGGLEHLNSTTLQTGRFSYSNEGSYFGFLSLVAHEYFHLWNVKRLRPVELGPFDYNNENYTSLLWFSEGFTAYYDDLIVRRCGFTTPENYLSTLAGNFSYVSNIQGGKVQSLEESSYDAWIKFYRPHENSANNSVSYYTKGAAAGAIMDLSIRQATAGKKSLDDVMQQLYQKYFLDNDGKKGFTAADFVTVLNQTAGKSQQALYDQLIAGTDSIAYGNYLSVAGLRISDLNAKSPAVWIGVGSSFKENKLTISTVERNGPGWKGGLNVNDEILAINNFRTGDDLSKLLANYTPGSTVKFTVARGGMIREIPVTLATSPAVKFSITPVSDAAPSAKEIYNNWLRIK